MVAKADDLTIRERDGVTVVRFNNESLVGHDVELSPTASAR
jgi:hypothetical protein